MKDELTNLDATEQAELVRRKEVSPLELVDAAITRIEKVNPQLNALITPLFDKARASLLPNGPFRGVPLIQFTPPYNATGRPAISLPLHWNAAGLPIEAHLVAGFGREDLLIQVSSQLEQGTAVERAPTTDLRVAKTLAARPALFDCTPRSIRCIAAFTEAFDTADLKDPRALLDELNNNPRS
jgi:Asp-tRNA(Asn)/Glu-tRNA(Gln) amidotransferase A subunit family amidase